MSLAVADGAAHIEFALDQGDYEWDPYVGAGFSADLAKCAWGIGYTYKGSKHTLRIEQSNVTDWDYHSNSKTTGNVSDWTVVNIPWPQFGQAGWGEDMPVDRTLVEGIKWYVNAATGTTGEIWVKDVRCLGDPDGGAVSVRPNRRPPSNNNTASFIRTSGRTLHLRFIQNGKVDIFDLKGAKIRTMKLQQGNHTIKMGDLPKGMYVVRANSGVWSQSVKMLVR
jgi:hypothetical protein